MRVLVLSDQCDDAGRRERLRVIAGQGPEVVLATAGGTAGSDGAVRLAPVAVRGDPADPAGQSWHAPTIRRLLADIRPTLVHIEAEPESDLAATASTLATKLGIPYVLFSWQSVPKPLGFIGRRRATRVLGGAAGVIGGNRLAMNLLHQQAPNAIATSLLPAGVTVGSAVDRPVGDELVVGFAGRLVPERGLAFLIEALRLTFGKWRLVVAGTGPEQEAIEAAAQRMGLASRLRWLGGLREESLNTLWSEIDCLAVLSRDTPTWVDHHSPILLEAMGRGITPIVTSTGALAELVGEAGPVVSDQEELTAALQAWVVDPPSCRARGAVARQWTMSRFSTTVVATKTIEFWTAAVEPKS